MVDSDEYVFERIITLNRLMTQSQIDECKKIKEEEGEIRPLYEIILEKDYLTQKTIDKVKAMQAEEVETEAPGKADAPESLESNSSPDEAGASNTPLSDDVTAGDYTVDKNDEIFLKIAVHNKMITEEQNQTVRRLIENNGVNAWEAALENGAMPAENINRILEKLENKFGAEFSARVEDLPPDIAEQHTTEPVDTSPATEKNTVPPSAASGESAEKSGQKETASPPQEQVPESEKESELEVVEDISAADNVSPDHEKEAGEILEEIEEEQDADSNLSGEKAPKPDIQPETVPVQEKTAPEKGAVVSSETPAAPSVPDQPEAARKLAEGQKSRTLIEKLTPEHKRLMKYTMCSRLHFQILRYIFENKSEAFVAREVAAKFGEKERKIRKIFKSFHKHGILIEMGKGVYNYGPGTEENRMIRELMTFFKSDKGHSQIMSFILAME